MIFLGVLMSDSEIQQLRAELARLDAAIAGLAGLPDAQAALGRQRAAKERELARLEGRAPEGGTHVDQSGQSGGVSFGAFNQFGDVKIGDVVGRDKISGPVIHGGIHSGRDANLAGGDQAIMDRAGGDTPAPPGPAELRPPPFRLGLTDSDGQPIAHLAVGDEATLRLELTGAPGELPALTLLATGDGVSWRAGTRAELPSRPGQPLRLPQWPFVAERAGPLTLQVLALSGATLLQTIELNVTVVGPVDADLLGGGTRATQPTE